MNKISDKTTKMRKKSNKNKCPMQTAMPNKLIEARSWEEFRDAGLLWWVNRILHLFGWAIVIGFNSDKPPKVVKVYPARVKYRGFDEAAEENGHKRVTAYLETHIEQLMQEATND